MVGKARILAHIKMDPIEAFGMGSLQPIIQIELGDGLIEGFISIGIGDDPAFVESGVGAAEDGIPLKIVTVNGIPGHLLGPLVPIQGDLMVPRNRGYRGFFRGLGEVVIGVIDGLHGYCISDDVIVILPQQQGDGEFPLLAGGEGEVAGTVKEGEVHRLHNFRKEFWPGSIP